MTVYADVLVFLNGVITYFLLLCVCAFFKFRPKTYRLILGAVLGGISALTVFLPDLNAFTGIVVRITACVIIVFATFSFKNIVRFLKYTLAFLTVTYIFGGATLALTELFNIKSVMCINGVCYFDIEPLFLILSSGVIYLFIRFLLLFKRKTADEQAIYNCIVEKDGVTVGFMGINDTGNSLCDPYFGSPVAIIEKKILQPILEIQPKTYLIPIKSVAASSTIYCFRPSAFYIEKDQKKIKIKDITIGICETKIHNRFSAILSPEITEIGEEQLCLTR